MHGSIRFRLGVFFLLFPVLCFLGPLLAAAMQEQQEQPDFPKKEEIQLVVNQAERAFEQYRQSVALQGRLPGMSQNDAMKRDRELVAMIPKLLARLKAAPDAFHGLGGLLLLSSLDDASRNAALCSSQGMSAILLRMLEKPDAAKAYEFLHVAQSCADVSSLVIPAKKITHSDAMSIRVGAKRRWCGLCWPD